MLKNLLSNAFKFTAHGGVRLRVGVATGGWSTDHPVLSQAPAVVAFSVSDTGIGIPPEKQRIIFEAFQQADAGTARKYGGTGLGLAISRELAHLLGGEIRLEQRPGQGSTFTLYLPLTYIGPGLQPQRGRRAATAASRHDDGAVPADRAAGRRARRRSPTTARTCSPATRVLLVVEDDPHYARILLDLARDKGFKVHAWRTTGADALALARKYQPDGHLARRLPARHARLDGAEPAEARPGHAPHPGADPHRRGRAPVRPGARRVLLHRPSR